MRSSVPAFWGMLMWTYFVAGAVDPVWPQEMPASRIAPAPSQVKPPTLPTLPQAAPQSPLSRPRKHLPFRTAGAQNASDRHCFCGNIDVVSEFTSRSSQEIVAEWADEICGQPHSARAHEVIGAALPRRRSGDEEEYASEVRERLERGGDTGRSGDRLCDDLHTHLGHCPVLQR